MAAEKWFRLGGKSSAFWDPTQPDPDSQFVGINDAKKLTVNPKVNEAKLKGGLVEITEAEAMEFLDDKKKKLVKADDKASAKLDAAAQKEESAKDILKQAEVKEKAVKKVLEENDQLKTELATLKARNNELETASAGTGTGAGSGTK